MSRNGPPDFLFDRLRAQAVIDFVTVHSSHPLGHTFARGQRALWSSAEQQLTLHDPSAADIRLLDTHAPEAPLMEMEVAVDLWPKGDVVSGDRQALLQSTFLAVAGRLRPEDMDLYGYGLRGSVGAKGQKPAPFNDRAPAPNEQLLYGSRGSVMQVKVYLKQSDQGKPLPEAEHRVRVEVALRRWALMELDLHRPFALLDFGFRAALCKHLRMVDHPEVRQRVSRPAPAELHEQVRQAWSTAGVGGFGVAAVPDDASSFARKAIDFRAKRQVPIKQVRLVRHVQANAVIGNALRQLDRRMAA